LQILFNNEKSHVLSALQPGYPLNLPVSYVIIDGTYCCDILLSQKHPRTHSKSTLADFVVNWTVRLECLTGMADRNGGQEWRTGMANRNDRLW
jgi:hypothetical protein